METEVHVNYISQPAEKLCILANDTKIQLFDKNNRGTINCAAHYDQDLDIKM